MFRLLLPASIVLQDSHLPSITLLDYITSSSPDPDHFLVEKCLSQVKLLDKLLSLPNKLMSSIGEGALSLSGGQKQRLSIARALYAMPLLLVFDEATSSQDLMNERVFNELVQDLKGSTTIALISHRLSICPACDQIFLVDEGRIVAQGSHESLIQSSIAYSRLWT